MKAKRSFTVLFILACLVCFLFTCKGPYEGEEVEYEYTDVVYSPDGNSITIYLDGQVSVPRSLNNGIARMSCDYFEVTFMYNNSGDYTVARGEWMAGKMAGISGIYRTTGGVNYGEVTNAPSSGSGSAILFAGKSDKTLMAIGRLTGVDGSGTQSSRVTTINANTKSVTFTISAITAGVKAVANGASGTSGTPATATGSSFVTNAGDTTGTPDVSRTTVFLNNKVFGTDTTVSFPIFKLTRDWTRATYTFALSNTGPDYGIGAYGSGIFISTPAFGNSIPGLPPIPPDQNDAQIEKKQPRYTVYDINGKPINEYHNSVLMLDENTRVILTNNNLPNSAFNPAVGFTFFNDTTISGTVFSLVFSIPVYALQEYESYDGAGNGIGIKSRWYIRSGYGPSLYDLDDGTSGMGGAVLLGTGEINKIDSGKRTIRIPGQEPENGGINGLPNKWQYYAAATSPPADVFNIDGLIVQLVGVGVNPEVFNEHINYNNLTFKLGKSDVAGRKAQWTEDSAKEYTVPGPTAPYYFFPAEFYGIIEITVEYYDNARDSIYQTSFYVLVGNSDHPFQTNFNIVNIYQAGGGINGTYTLPTGATMGDWNNTRGPGSPLTHSSVGERFGQFLEWADVRDRTTVIILHHSFNHDRFPNINSTSNNGVVHFGNIMVIAADDDLNSGNNTPDDIVLGRGKATNSGFYPSGQNLTLISHTGGGNAGLNAWYFGKWPFKGSPYNLNWPTFPYNNAGNINHTKTFTVNTEGPMYAVGVNHTITADNNSMKMLVDNDPPPSSGIYNVKVNGAVIHPTIVDSSGITRYPLLH